MKRGVDLALAIAIAPIILPVIVIVAVLLCCFQKGTPIYLSERMKTTTHGFTLWKFRTMEPDPDDSGVSGGDKSGRITKLGAFLRHHRLDEVPQWWNIVKGDISFVGPRPPLRVYVEKFPNLYSQVLEERPGVTGMATLIYHNTEQRLLAQCSSAKETDEVYSRRCVPKKAKIDVLYASRRTLCSDLRIILATVFRRIGSH
jgi:lipopolysaccharide/colanic/teichoic acid biosynthesis glycosyltransferase